MDVLKDPQELGKRIGAARGYRGHPGNKKTNFAKDLGVSVPTLGRIEAGEVGSIGTTQEQRRQLAERAMNVSGCPPELLGLSEPSATPPALEARLDFLDEQLQRLAQKALDEGESDEFLRPWSTDPRSEESDPGAENE